MSTRKARHLQGKDGEGFFPKHSRAFHSLAFLLLLAAHAAAQTVAFPGAEGAGRFASGGRGGAVYIVTNLNDSGAGSLRDGLSQPGARTIVFEVSGTINLQSTLYVPQYNVTVAGETAPGDGICVTGSAWLVGANNVIMRYVRSRPGVGNGDGFQVGRSDRGTTNVILDHVSASWGSDECLSVGDVTGDVTVQWSLISEGLINHSMGSLVRGGNGAEVTYHHNLYAHNNSRNPRPGNYSTSATDPAGLLFDFRNNVIYNWGGAQAGANFDTDGVSKYNFVNNYYKKGPNSGGTAFEQTEDAYCQAWFSGNSMNGSIPGNQWSLLVGQTGGSFRRTSALTTAPVTTQSAAAAYTSVLAGAGASRVRDKVDSRIVDEVTSGMGGIIANPSERGGLPTLVSLPAPADTDRDGMPDWWENANALNPSNAADRNLTNAAGYTRLEEYLHFRAERTGATATWDSTSTIGWGTAANWSSDVLPSFGNGLDVQFYASGATQLNNNLGGSDRTVRSLTFDENADSSFTVYLSSDNTDGGTARTLTMKTDRRGFAGNETSILVRPGATGSFTVGSGLGSITLEDPLHIHHAGSGTLAIKRPIGESGGARSLAKSGAGVLTMFGANTYSGGTRILAGTLSRDASNVMPDTGDVVVGGAAVFTRTGHVTDTIENLTLNSTGANVLSGLNITGTLNITTGTLHDINSSASATAATMAMSGGSVLRLGANSGSTTLSIGAGGLTMNGATLQFGNGGSTPTAQVNLGGNFTGTGTNAFTNASTTGPRLLDLQGGTRTFNVTGGTTTISPVMQNGALTKAGAGTLILAGANTFTGLTTINAGALQLGVNDAMPSGNDVALGGGTLDVNGTTQTLDSLTGSGSVLMGGGTLTLGSGGSSFTAAAVFSETGVLMKSGSGTLTLTGTHPFAGTTTVNAGSLLMNGTLSASALTVARNGRLAGDGTFGATAVINGRVSPGNNDAGIITHNAAVSFGATAEVSWQLYSHTNSGGSGAAYDRIAAQGVTIAAGAAIDITFNSAGSVVDFTDAFWTAARSWSVITHTSRTGTFALGSITPDAGGRVFSNYGIFALSHTATAVVLTWTPYTAQESWRLQYFGTVQDTGTAADFVDANNDGEVNLIEFATGQNPYTNRRVSTPLVRNGASLEFTYSRSNAALADGLTFTVEWSDTLAAGSWSSAGVVEQIQNDNGTAQTVKATVSSGAGKRFLRLKVAGTP